MICGLLLSTILVCYLCVPTHGWGDVGHRTIAYIANEYLSDQNKDLLDSLLPRTKNYDISDAAIWADLIKRKRPQNKTWHDVDVEDDPLGNQCNIGCLPSSCSTGGGCIIMYGHGNMTAQVNEDNFNQTEAVMFLFHFFGDLHMPLHVEEYEEGGNGVAVHFYGHRDNIHSIWDTDMPHKINGIKHRLKHNDEKVASLKWAQDLLQKNKHRRATALECMDMRNPQRCARKWAKETNNLNSAIIFKRGISYLTDVDLGGEYYNDAVPIILEQIFKAGVRLATWFNSIARERQAKAKDYCAGRSDGSLNFMRAMTNLRSMTTMLFN
ncbi:hypothetical protein N7454_001504 [Penicillium verhagenii]|nr:hypothetical protein N7454_001504 [Penicillium verhagenii]